MHVLACCPLRRVACRAPTTIASLSFMSRSLLLQFCAMWSSVYQASMWLQPGANERIQTSLIALARTVPSSLSDFNYLPLFCKFSDPLATTPYLAFRQYNMLAFCKLIPKEISMQLIGSDQVFFTSLSPEGTYSFNDFSFMDRWIVWHKAQFILLFG